MAKFSPVLFLSFDQSHHLKFANNYDHFCTLSTLIDPQIMWSICVDSSVVLLFRSISQQHVSCHILKVYGYPKKVMVKNYENNSMNTL